MTFEWLSTYDCRHCGFEQLSRTVEYDAFGYAVCPTCGVDDRPTVTP